MNSGNDREHGRASVLSCPDESWKGFTLECATSTRDTSAEHVSKTRDTRGKHAVDLRPLPLCRPRWPKSGRHRPKPCEIPGRTSIDRRASKFGHARWIRNLAEFGPKSVEMPPTVAHSRPHIWPLVELAHGRIPPELGRLRPIRPWGPNLTIPMLAPDIWARTSAGIPSIGTDPRSTECWSNISP